MRTIAALLVAAFFVTSLHAQTAPPPRITVVMPTGAKAGSTVELTVTGQELDKVEGLYFSFQGAKVEVLSAAKAPVDPKQKGGKPPPPATNQKFKVTIPDNAPLGFHDIRVVTKGGISNPRTFVVGDLNELVEKENNDDVPVAQKIELNTTVSGVINTPTDVDYFQFTGKTGQRVVASCLTTSIDSKLPAELQIVRITKGVGLQLGFSRNYWNNDAVADAVLPEDGEYYVRLCSFTYTLGGQDYFYRLTVSTAPWIDAVYPPVVELGKDAKVTVYGRNLPGGAVDPQALLDGRPLEKAVINVKAPSDAAALHRLAFRGFIQPTSGFLDGFEYRLKNEAGASNPVLIGYAKAPVVIDNEVNGTLDKAQPVPVPCEIAGRIQKKNDRDCYSFTAKKGQIFSIEVFADRLGSAMDTQFSLYNEQGDKLTDQDDNPDIVAPQFFNRTDDPPRYRFTAPADGKYTLVVTSKEAFLSYGPRYLYTARIAPEEPDFRVVAMPMSNYQSDAVILGQAGHIAMSVFVQRSGGFTGDITLSAGKLPPGLTIRPQIVAGNQKQAAVVVSAATEAPPYAGAIGLVATATITPPTPPLGKGGQGGVKATREVRGASITWSLAQQQQQQNTPTVSRLDRELVVAVRDKAPFILSLDKTQFAVPQGDRITIPLKLTAIDFKGGVQISALTLPTGMAMQPKTVQPGKDDTIILDSKTTVLPGNYTVVLRGQTQPPQPNQQPKPGGPRNLIQTTPPIFVMIVPKTLAKIAVPQNNPKIKVGGTVDVTIKIARQHDYSGAFEVKIDPKATKGVTAPDTTIKAGEDEVTLKLTAATGLQPGNNATVTVRLIAMFNDAVPVPHEAKFTLAVVK